MIGGGAFNIMSDMGGKAGGLAIIIGWIITAIGMISLAFVFQNLTNERLELDGGIYSYAQAGFGDFVDLSVLGDIGSQRFRAMLPMQHY